MVRAVTRATPIPRFDLLLGTGLAVAMDVELLARSDPSALALAVGLVTGLGHVGRRVLPLAAFATTAGAIVLLGTYIQPGWGDESAVLFVSLLLAEYALGAHADGSAMWLGAVVIACGVVWFTFHDGDTFYVEDIPFALAIVGGPWAAGLAMQLRRNHERVLAAENAELERTREEAARRAVASERARIARELHDVVSHAIAVTVLQARGARKLVGTDDEAVGRALDAIDRTNAAALGDMRRLLAVLRDTEDDTHRQAPQPTLANVGELVDHVRASGLPVELEVTGTDGVVPPGIDLSAYRIIQEALTNVLKHAGPSARAIIRVDYNNDGLELTVSDDGAGVSPDSAGGHGLAGIRERVAVVGGQVTAGPVPGGGYAVHARLPYSLEAS